LLNFIKEFIKISYSYILTYMRFTFRKKLKLPWEEERERIAEEDGNSNTVNYNLLMNIFSTFF